MPTDFTVKRFAKPAAAGAVGVALGVLALYLLIAFGSRPTDLGGIDGTHAVLTWISAAIPALAIVAAHLAYAKILYDEASRPS